MSAAVLIVTGDPWILDGLLRLAAAADIKAAVARAAEQAGPGWRGAALILVGADLADEPVLRGAPRRPGVVLVAAAGDPEVYRKAVGIGAQDVAMLPDADMRLADLMAVAAEPAGRPGEVLCVAGGRGGAGASVLSAVLGIVAARRGMRTLLVDGDPLGGGLDLVLGQEHLEGARWPEFSALRGRLSSAALQGSLPATSGPAVLSWHRGETEPVTAETMRSVLAAAVRGFDLVVVDLPRRLAEAEAEVLRAARRALLVVPAEVRATVAAGRIASELRRHASDIRVVVRGPAAGGLTGDVIAHALDLPLAGEVAVDRRIPTALEHGDLVRVSRRGPLTDLCRKLLGDIESAR
jgi:secretion/DNA translocation related CpaE-like protein